LKTNGLLDSILDDFDRKCFLQFWYKEDKKMKKITAYKVNNLNKVDPRFYVEGDHFLTDRSVGILNNGKIKNILGNEQLEKDVNTLKTDLINLTTRVEELEGGTVE